VTVRIVEVERAGVTELVLHEVEALVQPVVPVVVHRARDRQRVVSVEAAAGTSPGARNRSSVPPTSKVTSRSDSPTTGRSRTDS